MCSYRALTFAVAVMLVCLAAVAQADTMNILANTDCQQSQGVWAFSGSAFYNTSPSGNGDSDGRPHCIEIGSGSSAKNLTSHAILAGETFTLGWDAANIDGRTSSQNMKLAADLVYQDGTSLTAVGTTGWIAPPWGPSPYTWVTYGDGGSSGSVSFTAVAGQPYIGQNIGVKIAASSGGWGGIDNVYLNFTSAPTPEPSAIVILATGLLGLLAYAWRRRK
jgi:hypothetical protein